jgi:hypothetical protein
MGLQQLLLIHLHCSVSVSFSIKAMQETQFNLISHIHTKNKSNFDNCFCCSGGLNDSKNGAVRAAAHLRDLP